MNLSKPTAGDTDWTTEINQNWTDLEAPFNGVGGTEAVFNELGVNQDFRIEGDTAATLFFIDASADFIGINTSDPDRLLDVQSGGGSPQARLTYTNNSIFTDFWTDSNGYMWVTPTGGNFLVSVSSGSANIQALADSGTHAYLWARRGGTSYDAAHVAATGGTTKWAWGMPGGSIGSTSDYSIWDMAASNADHIRLISGTGLVFNEGGLDLDFRIEGDSLSHMFFTDGSAATENIALLAAAAPNWQSMDRGIFIGNSSAAPSGNPSSGGFLYVESGALKWRGPSTTTTIAPA